VTRISRALLALLALAIVAFSVWAIVDNAPLYLKTLLNGLTLASLYFLVASGFTLVFGLMRNVNLAHGSLYLLGAYVGWVVGEHTGSWLLAVAAGFLSAAVLGLLMQVFVFRHMEGQDLRQTLVTIGLSIVLADLMLWGFGGEIYTFDPPPLDLRLDGAAGGREVSDLPDRGADRGDRHRHRPVERFSPAPASA
jgi:branched-chain amino acid transport system permease protein